MMSRFGEKGDELLIEPSKTQRLTMLQQQYQMKEEALEKATDLIALLSDELESMKSSYSHTIEALRVKLDHSEQSNHTLSNKLKQLEELISHKQSRIVGFPPFAMQHAPIPPSARRNLSGEKKQSKSRVKEEIQPAYNTCHMDFLKSLSNILLTKIFETHKEAEYILNVELEEMGEVRDRLKEYKMEMGEFHDISSDMNSKDKGELFEIIAQQQQIINRLKGLVKNAQSLNMRSLIEENLQDMGEDIGCNLVQQLKILLDIVTQSIRGKSAKSRSTDYRIKKGRQIQTPYEYIALMESYASKQKYLSAENKQLKNIIEGLISHIKR